MNSRKLFLTSLIFLFTLFSLKAQQINLSDSVQSRIGIVTQKDVQIYPLIDVNHVLKFKSSIYLFFENPVNAGISLSDESFSIDGMNVRGLDYVPYFSGSKMEIHSSFDINASAYSPSGKFDFKTANPVSEKEHYEGRFYGSPNSLQVSLTMSNRKLNKRTNRFIEMFLSANSYSQNSTPSFVDKYTITEPALEQFKLSPFCPSNNNYFGLLSTESTKLNDLKSCKAIPETKQKQMRIYGNIKVPIKQKMTLTIQSLYSIDKGKRDVFENRLFNYMNNPDFRKEYYDGKISFEHDVINKEELKLQYRLGLSIDNQWSHEGNDKFGKDFFKYNYVGSFTENRARVYDIENLEEVETHTMQGWATTSVNFIPGSFNPGLVNYINNTNPDDFNTFISIQNAYTRDKTSSGWNNFGTPVSNYQQQQNSRISVNGETELQINQAKITLGFDYRNDTYRSYSVNTGRLYSNAMLLTNAHIKQLDINHPLIETIDGIQYINYYRLYNAGDQTVFDKNLRGQLGLAENGIHDIQFNSYNYMDNTIKYYDENDQLQTLQLKDELLNLKLFGVDELNGIVETSGYDIYNQKVKHSHDPYSTEIDGAQIPYSPTNLAVWLDYKVTKGQATFKAGIRLERFDARQPVLADPLSFYRISTVAETPQLNHSAAAHPDWLVYLDMNNVDNVLGYRTGNEWFTSNGSTWNPEFADGILPYLKDGRNFELKNVNFTDYKPQYNILPYFDFNCNLTQSLFTRISFNSFTRMPYLNIYNASRYRLMNFQSGSPIENSNLKPERFDRINLVFGFFSAKSLNASASIDFLRYNKIIYQQFVRYGFPVDYYTYSNSDKSFIIPTLNFKVDYQRYWWEAGMQYSHTFIEKEMSVKDITEKNMQSVYFTLSRDIGQVYSALKFHRILEGLSIAEIMQYRAGTPYYVTNGILLNEKTKQMSSTVEMDLKIKYAFTNKKQDLGFEIYIQALNLLDTKILYYVYGSTGLPNDNGYLSDPKYQASINSNYDAQAFRDQYALIINRPEYYGQPRTFWLGLSINF